MWLIWTKNNALHHIALQSGLPTSGCSGKRAAPVFRHIHINNTLLWSDKNVSFLRVCFLQVLLDTMALPVRVNTSIVVWGITVWSTMRLVKGSVSAWITVNHTINLCAVQMGSCTRTTVSSTGPPVSEHTGLPSCTVRSASTKVRASVTFSNVEYAWTSGYCSLCPVYLRSC